jgi:hypothetical protein
MRGQPWWLERPMEAWRGWNDEINTIIHFTFNSSNDADHHLTYIGSRLVALTGITLTISFREAATLHHRVIVCSSGREREGGASIESP